MPEHGSTKTGSQWFLEIGGSKTGPWTLDQIRDLLKGGKIQPTQKAITGDAEICSVQEILDRATAPSSSAHLPPRPTEAVTAEPSAEPIPTRRVDPVLDLFNALQSSKDRKAAQKPQMQPTDFSPAPKSAALFQTKAAWLALIVVLLGGFAFSAFKLLHRSNDLGNNLTLNSPTSPVREKVSAPASNIAAAHVVHTPPPAPQPVHTTAPVRAFTPPPSLPKPTFQATRDADRERRQREEELEKERERERDRDRDPRDRDPRDRDPRDREREEQIQNPNPSAQGNDFAGGPAPGIEGTAPALQNSQNHPPGWQPAGGSQQNNRGPNSLETQ